MRSKRSRSRGAAMVAMAVSLSAFLAVAVVAVDLGRLGYTATEVQTIADIAATAGATALMNDADAVAEAQSVVGQNSVDGTEASISASDVEVGFYNHATGGFSAGGVPANGVRATGRATVANLIAGVFGDDTTTVVKRAIAAISGAGSGRPALPIVVGDCNFEAFQNSYNCSDLPSLTQAPNTSNDSGWTSLSTTAASASAAQSYLPASCGGGGEPSPTLHTGDYINVLNGQTDSILQTLKKCFDQGLTQFTIPIVPCGQYNQGMQVLGFATVEITAVKAKGKNKGMSLRTTCEADEPGAPGGGAFGTSVVTLVN